MIRRAGRVLTSLHCGGAATSLLALVLHASALRAETGPPQAEARRLFKEARDLVNAGQFERACPKLEQSLRLDDGIGTEFNLADCRERLGEDMLARDLFVRVADRAQALGQRDRERVARERAASLEPTAFDPVSGAPRAALEAVVVRASVARTEQAPAEDLQKRITTEYGVLAEADVAIRELEATAVILDRDAPRDPSLRSVRVQILLLRAELAKAWLVAGRVTAELTRRSGSRAKRASIGTSGRAQSKVAVVPKPDALATASLVP